MFRSPVLRALWTPSKVRQFQEQRAAKKEAYKNWRERNKAMNPKPVAKPKNSVSDKEMIDFIAAVNESHLRFGLAKKQSESLMDSPFGSPSLSPSTLSSSSSSTLSSSSS